LDGFVEFMAENVRTLLKMLKVMRYTICSMEQGQGQQETCLEVKGACFNLKQTLFQAFQIETCEPSANAVQPR